MFIVIVTDSKNVVWENAFFFFFYKKITFIKLRWVKSIQKTKQPTTFKSHLLMVMITVKRPALFKQGLQHFWLQCRSSAYCMFCTVRLAHELCIWALAKLQKQYKKTTRNVQLKVAYETLKPLKKKKKDKTVIKNVPVYFRTKDILYLINCTLLFLSIFHQYISQMSLSLKSINWLHNSLS